MGSRYFLIFILIISVGVFYIRFVDAQSAVDFERELLLFEKFNKHLDALIGLLLSRRPEAAEQKLFLERLKENMAGLEEVFKDINKTCPVKRHLRIDLYGLKKLVDKKLNFDFISINELKDHKGYIANVNNIIFFLRGELHSAQALEQYVKASLYEVQSDFVKRAEAYSKLQELDEIVQKYQNAAGKGQIWPEFSPISEELLEIAEKEAGISKKYFVEIIEEYNFLRNSPTHPHRSAFIGRLSGNIITPLHYGLIREGNYLAVAEIVIQGRYNTDEFPGLQKIEGGAETMDKYNKAKPKFIKSLKERLTPSVLERVKKFGLKIPKSLISICACLIVPSLLEAGAGASPPLTEEQTTPPSITPPPTDKPLPDLSE